MKKRGFKPTSRTFATFFSGCSTLESFSPKQLDRIRGIWIDFEKHMSRLESDHGKRISYPDHASPSPYVPYIELEGRLEAGGRLEEIISSLRTSGPFAPDKRVYTALMNALSRRKSLKSDAGIVTDWQEVQIQNAKDVQRLWIQMIRQRSASPSHQSIADSYSLAAFLWALSKGDESHQLYALDVGSQLLGLDGSKSTSSPKIPLDHRTVGPLLEICNSLQRYDLTVQYIEGIMSSPTRRKVLTTSVMDHALEAYGYLASLPSYSPSDSQNSLSKKSLQLLHWMLREAYSDIGPQILPSRKSYNYAFLTSWRSVDWESAQEIFQIMTGLNFAHFDGAAEFEIKSSKPNKTRMDLDAQSMSYLLRTAVAKEDDTILKSLVRVFQHYGYPHFFGETMTLGAMEARGLTKREAGEINYYRYKLATSLQSVLIRLLDESSGAEVRGQYKELLVMVKDYKSSVKEGEQKEDGVF